LAARPGPIAADAFSQLDNPRLRPDEPAWEAQVDAPATQPRYATRLSTLGASDLIEDLVLGVNPSRFAAVHVKVGGKSRWSALDLTTAKLVGKAIEEDPPLCVSPRISFDGRYLADRLLTGDVAVWSFATGRKLCTVNEIEKGEVGFELTSQHRLVVLHHDGSSTVCSQWDVRTGQLQGRFVIHEDGLSIGTLGLAISPGGKYAAVIEAGSLSLLDLAKDTVLSERMLTTKDSGECRGIAFSPDAQKIAVVFSTPEHWRLYGLDARHGTVLFEQTIAQHEALFQSQRSRRESNPLDWTWDSGCIVANGARLFDGQTGKDVYTLPLLAGGNEPRRIVRAWDMLTVVVNDKKRRHIAFIALDRDALDGAVTRVRRSGEAVDALLPPLTAAKYGGMLTVLADSEPGWRSVNDGTETPARLPDRIKVAENFERVVRVHFSTGPATKLVLVRDEPITSQHTRYLQSIEARSTKHGPRIDVDRRYELLDVSPDGELALLSFNEDTSRHERLDIVGLSAAKQIVGWRPYADEAPANAASEHSGMRNVHWAALLDRNHVATCSQPGRLIVWKVPECRAIYQLRDVDLAAPIGLSPQRRYLGVRIGAQLLIIESHTGHIVARHDLPADVRAAHYAFRPDAREFYLCSHTSDDDVRVERFETIGGHKLGEISFAGSSPTISAAGVGPNASGGVPEFFRNDHLALLHGKSFVNVEHGRLLWHYELAPGHFAADNSPDGRIWYCERSIGWRPAVELIAVDPFRDEVRRAANNNGAAAGQSLLGKNGPEPVPDNLNAPKRLGAAPAGVP
jgi:WD40 repeat protein